MMAMIQIPLISSKDLFDIQGDKATHTPSERLTYEVIGDQTSCRAIERLLREPHTACKSWNQSVLNLSTVCSVKRDFS